MFSDMKNSMENFISMLDHKMKIDDYTINFSTGFLELDYKINGLQSGNLIVIAGRPSIGKSAFALNLIESLLFNHNQPILYFNFELTKNHIMARLISSFGRVHHQHLNSTKLDGEEWAKVTSSIVLLQEKELFICDDPSISLEQIGKQIHKFCEDHPKSGCIIIDDIQRIKPQKSLEGKLTRSDELTEISRYLKELALQYDIPIIIVSQLNRNLESRPNKRPVISDLRDCGAIEDNADLILFIYRDEVYNRESKDVGTAEIIIGKHRHGSTDTVRLAFEGQYTRFSNLSPEFYNNFQENED